MLVVKYELLRNLSMTCFVFCRYKIAVHNIITVLAENEHFQIFISETWLILCSIILQFRCNFEEILINSRYDIYGNSISCTIWSHVDYKLLVRNNYCLHLDASGKQSCNPASISKLCCLPSMYDHLRGLFYPQFFSSLSKTKDEHQNGKLETIEMNDKLRYLRFHDMLFL